LRILERPFVILDGRNRRDMQERQRHEKRTQATALPMHANTLLRLSIADDNRFDNRKRRILFRDVPEMKLASCVRLRAKNHRPQ
jgi:hypothetical protein